MLPGPKDLVFLTWEKGIARADFLLAAVLILACSVILGHLTLVSISELGPRGASALGVLMMAVTVGVMAVCFGRWSQLARQRVAIRAISQVQVDPFDLLKALVGELGPGDRRYEWSWLPPRPFRDHRARVGIFGPEDTKLTVMIERRTGPFGGGMTVVTIGSSRREAEALEGLKELMGTSIRTALLHGPMDDLPRRRPKLVVYG